MVRYLFAPPKGVYPCSARHLPHKLLGDAYISYTRRCTFWSHFGHIHSFGNNIEIKERVSSLKCYDNFFCLALIDFEREDNINTKANKATAKLNYAIRLQRGVNHSKKSRTPYLKKSKKIKKINKKKGKIMKKSCL